MGLAIRGRGISEIYSKDRIKIAVARSHVRMLLRTDVSEMFSPERVTKMCEEFGLKAGDAMDIENGFNFDMASDRKKCRESIVRDGPKLVIGSPPCTMFS